MKSNNLTFERARGLVKGCLYAAIAFLVVGLLLSYNNAEDLTLYTLIAAVILIAVALFLVAVCMKCPYCGKHIIVKCLTTKTCTHCGRNLETGLKAKGKKRK